MDKLDISSKRGLYSVAFLVMTMPVAIFGLTKFFSMGEPLNLSAIDWFWSISSVISGLLLFIRLKIAWLISIFQILLVGLLNVFQVVTHWGEPSVLQYNFQFLFSISMMSSIFLIASYFKYPYLDRRDTWFFGVANRHSVKMKATVNDKIFGEVVSASISGVLFRAGAELKLDKNQKIVLSIPELNLESVPVQIIDQKGSDVRLQFASLGFGLTRQMKKILKQLPKED